jgi:hypothetical protein
LDKDKSTRVGTFTTQLRRAPGKSTYLDVGLKDCAGSVNALIRNSEIRWSFVK